MNYSAIKDPINFSKCNTKNLIDIKSGDKYIVSKENERSKEYLFYQINNKTGENYLYIVEFILTSENEYWKIDFRTLESNFERPNIGEYGVEVFKKLRKVILDSNIKKFCFISTRDEKNLRIKTIKDRLFEIAIKITFDCKINWKKIIMPRHGEVLVGYFEI